MNKKNAKSILLKETNSILPSWWNEMFQNVLSIIKHSRFPSFKHAERFFVAALSYVPDKENSDLKYINVKCENKGEKDGYIYITIMIFFKFKDKKKDLWKLSKSLHVKKRKIISVYD